MAVLSEAQNGWVIAKNKQTHFCMQYLINIKVIFIASSWFANWIEVIFILIPSILRIGVSSNIFKCCRCPAPKKPPSICDVVDCAPFPIKNPRTGCCVCPWPHVHCSPPPQNCQTVKCAACRTDKSTGEYWS